MRLWKKITLLGQQPLAGSPFAGCWVREVGISGVEIVPHPPVELLGAPGRGWFATQVKQVQ